MDNQTIVSNLVKISTLLADESDYELWIAPTLQEAIDHIELSESKLLTKYGVPTGWTGTVYE